MLEQAMEGTIFQAYDIGPYVKFSNNNIISSNNSGWKLQLAISPTDVERACTILADVFDDDKLFIAEFKALDAEHEHVKAQKYQKGKAVVLYLTYNALEPENIDKLTEKLQLFEQRLLSSNIKPEFPKGKEKKRQQKLGSLPIKGSKFFRYTNDRAFFGTPEIIAKLEAAELKLKKGHGQDKTVHWHTLEKIMGNSYQKNLPERIHKIHNLQEKGETPLLTKLPTVPKIAPVSILLPPSLQSSDKSFYP